MRRSHSLSRQPTADQTEQISEASRWLVSHRDGWLAIVGRTEDGEERTLTTLYNRSPSWLKQAHSQLDAAVLAAFGWPESLFDDQILARLLDLNLVRSGATVAKAGGAA